MDLERYPDCLGVEDFKCHYALVRSRRIIENKQNQFRDLAWLAPVAQSSEIRTVVARQKS